MLSFLPAPLRAAVALLLLVANTLWWCTLLFTLALARLLLPFTAARRVLDPWLNAVACAWIDGNSGWMRLTQATAWQVDGFEALPPQRWYMVICNHQSWVDIFVLQHLLNRRIPLLKFFLKQQLLYVPVMGLAWWALDFPFMRRHSEQVLRRHPEKRLQDLEATRRACERFALVPTSVMNFVEGTRYTAAKQAAQRSPYRHLLKPKAGGLAMALAALGERFDSLLDVTIVYPDGVPTFWQFLRGDVRRIVVHAERHAIPGAFLAPAADDPDNRARKRVQRWLHALWLRKDARIDGIVGAGAAPARPGNDAAAGAATEAVVRRQ